MSVGTLNRQDLVTEVEDRTRRTRGGKEVTLPTWLAEEVLTALRAFARKAPPEAGVLEVRHGYMQVEVQRVHFVGPKGTVGPEELHGRKVLLLDGEEAG